MSVDSINAATIASEQSQYINKKKRENEELQNSLIAQKGQIEQQRKQLLTSEQDKTNKDLVAISKQGESMLEKARAMQTAQLQNLNQNSQEHFDMMAKETSKKIKELDQASANILVKHQQNALEKVKSFDAKAEDPFYRQKNLDATIHENEKNYVIKIKLPQHEAKNLYINTEKNILKLSLARSFADRSEIEEGHANRTSSYQTILESYQLPTQLDPKEMKRDYADGTLTIQIGKLT